MAGKELLPVYLFVGNDKVKRRVLLNKLRKRLFGNTDDNLDVEVFTGDKNPQFSPSDLLTALDMIPWLAPHRMVAVLNMELLGKEYIDVFLKYIKAPSSDIILVLDAEKLTPKAKIRSAVHAISPTAVVDCDSGKKYDLLKLIVNMGKTQSLQIEQNAAELLLKKIGDSTVALDNEIKRLAATLKPQGVDTLSASDVKKLTVGTVEPTVWELGDALAERNLAATLAISRQITEQPYRLLLPCLMRIRELITYKTLLERNEPNVAKAMGKQEWQLKSVAKGQGRYSAKQLQQALISGADCNAAMMSGTDPRAAFEDWLINAVG